MQRHAVDTLKCVQEWVPTMYHPNSHTQHALDVIGYKYRLGIQLRFHFDKYVQSKQARAWWSYLLRGSLITKVFFKVVVEPIFF